MKKAIALFGLIAALTTTLKARDVAGAGELFDPSLIILAPLGFFEIHTSGDFMDPGSLHTNLLDSVAYPWIAQKVDMAAFETALALKADASAVTAVVNSSSNAIVSLMTNALVLKANASDVTTAMALKADATVVAANFSALTNNLGLMTNAISANAAAITTKQALLPTAPANYVLGGDGTFHVPTGPTNAIQITTTNNAFATGGVYNNSTGGALSFQVPYTLNLGTIAGGCETDLQIRTNSGAWVTIDQAADNALLSAARSPKGSLRGMVPNGWDMRYTNITATGGSTITYGYTQVSYFNY